jgi:hypothetical protein
MNDASVEGNAGDHVERAGARDTLRDELRFFTWRSQSFET